MKEALTILKENGKEAFLGAKAEWQQVFGSADCAPFLSWEWMSTWFECFGEKKEPVVLKAYRNGRVAAILPFCFEKKRILGKPASSLTLMSAGIGGADYLGMISRPADQAEVASAMIKFLNHEGGFDSVCFAGIDNDSEIASVLRSTCVDKGAEELRVSESVGAVCPQIDLAAGWNNVLDRSKRKSNFTRKLKKLEGIPGFEFRSITSAHETGAAFERFLQLHEKRWKGAGGSELSGHPRLVAFQRKLVPQLASAGLVRFDELWLEGRCRSSIYGLDNGRTFYFYNSGYDLGCSHLSVGLAVLGLSIKNAIERGNSVYDFLRGDEAYKFEWANRQKELICVNVYRDSIELRANDALNSTLTALKNFSKNALPSTIADTIGAWRRARRRRYELSGEGAN